MDTIVANPLADLLVVTYGPAADVTNDPFVTSLRSKPLYHDLKKAEDFLALATKVLDQMSVY